MSKPFLAIVTGSKSDLPGVNACFDIPPAFIVPFEARTASACRTPEVTREYVRAAEQRSRGVAIAAVGMAAHRADPSLGQKLRDEWAANAVVIHSKNAAMQG